MTRRRADTSGACTGATSRVYVFLFLFVFCIYRFSKGLSPGSTRTAVEGTGWGKKQESEEKNLRIFGFTRAIFLQSCKAFLKGAQFYFDLFF